MVHGIFAGATDYSNQSQDSIKVDIANVQEKAEILYKDREKYLAIVDQIYNLPKFSNNTVYNLHDFRVELYRFFLFIDEILLVDNIDILDSLKNDEITEKIINKVNIISRRAWKFNRNFSKSYPGEFFTVRSDDEIELDRIFEQIDFLVTSMMDYGNMADRMKDFIVNTNQSTTSLKSILVNIWCDILDSQSILPTKTENDLNTFFRMMLSQNKTIKVSDQTLRGESAHGKTLGEIDLWVEYEDKTSVIEALRTNSLKKDYIVEHINRVKKYDKRGNAENFILVYFYGGNLSKFSNKYRQLIEKSSDISYDRVRVNEDKKLSLNNIKIFDMSYYLNGNYSKITHIILNIG